MNITLLSHEISHLEVVLSSYKAKSNISSE